MNKKILYSIFLFCIMFFGGIVFTACNEKPKDPPVPPVAKEEITVDGVKYIGTEDKSAYKCVGFVEDGEKITLSIPNVIQGVPVIEVVDEAFSSTNIESLTIGANVKHIGFKAFYNCDALTNVFLGKGLETLGQEPFSHSNSIETFSISVDNNTYYSENNALIRKTDNVLVVGTIGATAIPNGVTEIGEKAYYGVFCCDKVFDLTIPASVTKVGKYAFYRPVALKSISFAQDSELTTIDDYAFSGYNAEIYDTKLKEVIFPQCLTSVGIEAFVNHKGLESIKFTTPETSSLKIGKRAFANNPNLESVNFGLAQKTFENEVFRYCGLSEVTLENIVDAAQYVFRQSENLSKVIVKGGVAKLGDQMFYQCSKLESVDFTNVGTTFETFGKETFYSCKALKNTIQSESTSSFEFPQTTKHIEESAFFNCDGITSFKLNRGVTTIGNHAFAYCDGITSIWLPNTVEKVGDTLFTAAAKLIGVCIEANEIATIGSNWSSGHKVKTEFSYDASKHTAAADENFTYELNRVGTEFEYSILKYVGTTETNIVIPDQIGEYKVTMIPNKLFTSNQTITSITFGKNIRTVGEQAFYNCDKITSITLNEGLQEIGKEAFIFCDGITEITIPKTVKVIGSNLFQSAQVEVTFTIYAYDEKGNPHNYPKTDGEHYDFAIRNATANFKVIVIDNVSE